MDLYQVKPKIKKETLSIIQLPVKSSKSFSTPQIFSICAIRALL